MAEVINEIIGKEAFAQIERMEKGLNGLVDTFVKSANAAKLMESVLGDTKGVTATTDAIKELNKEQQKNETILKKIAIAESEQGKIMAENAVRLQALNTANKNAARENLANEGSVNQMSAALLRLQRQYDALSKAEAASPFGKQLLGSIQALDVEIKAIDGTLGRFGRNVGNYGMITKDLAEHLSVLTNQFRSLDAAAKAGPAGVEMQNRIKSATNAIQLLNAQTGPAPAANSARYKNEMFGLTQVFRELPGFTYSAQTGILGLSNNLPILAENFKTVAAATNEVTGKVNGTVGAMKIFASSILSFGNIFAIAIGLFTIFSKQIFEFIQGTKQADEATKKLSETIATETGKFETLNRQINNHNLSTEQRIKAAKEMQQLYPKALANYTAEEILAGKAAGAIMKIKDALVAVAMARAAQADLEAKAAEKYQVDKLIEEKKTQLIYAQQRAQVAFNRTIGNGSDAAAMMSQSAQQNVIGLTNDIKDLTKQSLNLDNAMNKIAGSISTLSTSTEVLTKDPKTKKKKEQTDKKEAEKTYNLKGWGDVMSNLDMFANEGNGIGAQAELIRQRLQAYIDENPISISIKWTRADRFAVFLEQLKKALEEAVELTAQSTQIMSDISDAIYANEMKRITAREKKMNEYYDAETKRVNSSFTNQADKDRELKKLEVQKEAQQKRIDRDRITADRKRAQQQKAYDIANITTSTALAVIKAYTEGDPLTKIPRAILAAAAGAASLARAIAAPIPQYAKGTDSHIGGLAVVGEQGTELVTLPSGKQFLTPSTDTLMNLPKGTKVLNNEKLMQSVYNLAFKKLGNGMAVNTDSMQVAMLEAFNELTTDVKELKKAMIGKDTNVNIIGNFDHYMHIKKNIR